MREVCFIHLEHLDNYSRANERIYEYTSLDPMLGCLTDNDVLIVNSSFRIDCYTELVERTCESCGPYFD